jgi:hypothetical protein
MNNNLQHSVSKKDLAKIILVAVIFLLVALVAFKANRVVEENKAKAKIEVIKGNDKSIEEYRDSFEYNPDYNDFFEVEDEIVDGVVYKTSAGENKIRSSLGSLMYRAHPKLIQKNSTACVYKTLIDDPSPNKGKIFWVAGKVLSISKGPKVDEILSAQFIYLYQIESTDGGIYELQSIRGSNEIRLGDIVYMTGVFLKLKKQKIDNSIVVVMLGNSIQLQLTTPAIWETKEKYANHLKDINEKNINYIDIPKELDLNKWKAIFESELKINSEVWSKVKDKNEEESKQLEPELEQKIIKDLSTTSNSILLGLVDLTPPYDQLIKNKEQNRQKIFRVVGKLDSFTEAMLPEPINGLDKVYYATIKDLKGDLYKYSYLTPNFVDQEDRELWKKPEELIPKVGDIVVCTGIFIKVVKEEDGKSTPFIYGKYLADIGDYTSIWNSVDHGEKRTAKNNWGGNVNSTDYLEAGQVERKAFSYLLAKASYTDAETIKKSFLSTPEATKNSFAKMMNDPINLTDQPFYAFGVIRLIKKIEGTQYYDFHGVKDVYEIYFSDIDFNLYTFISLNLPEGAALHKRMFFSGYFLKKFAFKNADNSVTWSPYIVGYIDSVEQVVEKKMSFTEKVILVLFSTFGLGFLFYLISQNYANHKKINNSRNETVQFTKMNRDIARKLVQENKILNEILITSFNHTLVEDLPVPIELCQNINHWPKSEPGNAHTLLRPDTLKSAYDAIVLHFTEFGTDIPKDIKAVFFNKRKELLGLRTFQVSKFEVPAHEKKRTDSFLIIPLSFIKVHAENLDGFDGYFDANCLPPWNTWMHIGKIPKYVQRQTNEGYTPETLVLVCYIPTWMAERLKEKFRVIAKDSKEIIPN